MAKGFCAQVVTNRIASRSNKQFFQVKNQTIIVLRSQINISIQNANALIFADDSSRHDF